MDSMSQASRHSYAYQHQHHQHAPSTPPEHDQLEEPENYDDDDEDDKLGVEGGGKDGEPPKKKRRRQALSCTECKRRKIKCDRNHPCGPCTRRGEMSKCRWTVVEPLEKFVTRGEWEEMRRKVAYLESLVMPLVAAQSHSQPPQAPPSYAGPPPPPPPPAVPVPPPPPPPPAPAPPAQPAYAYSHPSQHAQHYAPQPPQPLQPPHVPAVPPVPAVQHMSQGSDDSPASRPGTGHTAGSSGHGHGGGQPGWSQTGYSYAAARGEEEGRSGKRRKASVPAASATSGQDNNTYDPAYTTPGYDYPGRPFAHPGYAHHPGHHPHPYHMQHGHAPPLHPPPPFAMGFGHPFAHHPRYHGGPPPPRHAGADVEMKEGGGYGYASGHHGYAAGPPSTGPPAPSSSKMRGGSRTAVSSSSSSGPASGFAVHSVGGRRNSPPPPPTRRVSPPPSPARRASLPASRFEHGRRSPSAPSSPPRLAPRSYAHSVGRSSPTRLATPIPPSRARPSSPSSGSSRPPAPATASTSLASSLSMPSRLMSHPRSLPSHSPLPPSQPRPPSPSSKFHLNPLPSINQLALGLPVREGKGSARSSSEGRNGEDGDWEMEDTRHRELPSLREVTGKAKAEVNEDRDRSGASTPTPSTGRPTISSGASRAGALKDEPASEDIKVGGSSNTEELVATTGLGAAGADGDGANTNNSTLPNFPSNALGFIAMTGLGMAARGKGKAVETAGASTSLSAGASTSTASSSLTRPDTDRVRAYPAGTADPYLGVAGASTSQTIGAISADREAGSGAGVRRRLRDWEPGKGTAYYPHMLSFLRQPSSATTSSKWAPRGRTMPVGVGMLLDVDLLSSAEAGGADGELLVLSAGVEQAVVDTDVEMVDAAT